MSPMVVLWEACGQGGGGQWSPGTCMWGTDQRVDCRLGPSFTLLGSVHVTHGGTMGGVWSGRWWSVVTWYLHVGH